MAFRERWSLAVSLIYCTNEIYLFNTHALSLSLCVCLCACVRVHACVRVCAHAPKAYTTCVMKACILLNKRASLATGNQRDHSELFSSLNVSNESLQIWPLPRARSLLPSVIIIKNLVNYLPIACIHSLTFQLSIMSWLEAPQPNADIAMFFFKFHIFV